jgi:hypothetical protein
MTGKAEGDIPLSYGIEKYRPLSRRHLKRTDTRDPFTQTSSGSFSKKN